MTTTSMLKEILSHLESCRSSFNPEHPNIYQEIWEPSPGKPDWEDLRSLADLLNDPHTWQALTLIGLTTAQSQDLGTIYTFAFRVEPGLFPKPQILDHIQNAIQEWGDNSFTFHSRCYMDNLGTHSQDLVLITASIE